MQSPVAERASQVSPVSVATSGLDELEALVGTTRAHGLVDAGLVYRVGDSLLVASPSRDILLRTRDIFVAWASGSLLVDGESLQTMIASLSRRWPSKERILLRAAPDVSPHGFAPYARYLWKRPSLTSPPNGFDIRLATSARDWAWVQAALAKAHQNAYGSNGQDLDVRQLMGYVRRTFNPTANTKLRASVAYEDSQPVAHATVIEDIEDEVTGVVRDELVDILVMPEVAGRGHGAALLAVVERAAAERKTSLLGNVVAERGSDHWLSVVERLHGTGWDDEYGLWLRPIRQPSPG